MNIGSQARDVKDLFVIRDHVYVGDRHLRGGQSERQCSEGIAVTVKFADDDGPEGTKSIVVGKFDVYRKGLN
ncbi:hypothetical protein [Rubripirellula obstinata]|uniref:hypothetical protein n=1 Tax=Rubripirellula obstinata TaxID=406547 RepID=UPI00122D4908|nr:hypothetical protein [Rubripirellula obstinata]